MHDYNMQVAKHVRGKMSRGEMCMRTRVLVGVLVVQVSRLRRQFRAVQAYLKEAVVVLDNLPYQSHCKICVGKGRMEATEKG
jgi:hypothetical protein